VVVGRRTVGYLAKEEAPRYQPVLLRLVSQDLIPVVSSRIWAREDTYPTWDDRGREGQQTTFHSRVSIALAEPHMLVPLNLKPSPRHALLPIGTAVQVTGEESRMAAIAPWLRPEGEAWVHASLHPIKIESARASKTIVEVRIDDAPVGILTPKMSAEYRPAIEHLSAQGVTTAVRAIVKGNRLKAEVVLYGQRAHELSAAWIDSLAPSQHVLAATSTAAGPDTPGPAAHVGDAQRVWRFNSPPGWPKPPEGWCPPPGWKPPADWPAPPLDWQFWV